MADIKSIAGKVLGERTGEYKNYAPEVLVPVPRNLSIEYLETKMEDIPGKGADLWYSYEFRCLTDNGLPVASVIKFVFPHTTKNIIESKSLKLYCNSFTMEKMGITKSDALFKACKIMRDDLSKAAEGEVQVSVIDGSKKEKVFQGYAELTTLVDPEIEVSVYNEDKSLLQVEETDEVTPYRLSFDALRSKCRITNQPDSGTFYLYYKSKKHITEESLVRYFASFTDQCHFHEEILICAFLRLSELLDKDDELFCTALYQRRGSLDIGPFHYKNCEPEEVKALTDYRTFAYDPGNLFR